MQDRQGVFCFGFGSDSGSGSGCMVFLFLLKLAGGHNGPLVRRIERGWCEMRMRIYRLECG